MGGDSESPSQAQRPVLKGLTKRPEYLAVARGKRWVTPGFVVQTRPSGRADEIRFGLTVSRKVGNAVKRNRAKRRLRELVRLHLVDKMVPGHDIVLIGRQNAIKRPFHLMVGDLGWALKRLGLRPAQSERVKSGREAGKEPQS